MPIKCNNMCPKKPMMGRSWWKCYGFADPCLCAFEEREKEQMKKEDINMNQVDISLQVSQSE